MFSVTSIFYDIEYFKEDVEIIGETKKPNNNNYMRRNYVYSIDSTFRQSRAI